MSAGMHRLWKDDFVRLVNPRAGEDIIDMAGGTGDIAFRLEASGAHVTVADINPAMLEVGMERAAERGLPLITATTFGLALPHVCLLAHPTEGFRVRISPGSSEVIEPLELATFVAETL
jgi:SAM-dependent methyltransferase